MNYTVSVSTSYEDFELPDLSYTDTDELTDLDTKEDVEEFIREYTSPGWYIDKDENEQTVPSILRVENKTIVITKDNHCCERPEVCGRYTISIKVFENILKPISPNEFIRDDSD